MDTEATAAIIPVIHTQLRDSETIIHLSQLINTFSFANIVLLNLKKLKYYK